LSATSLTPDYTSAVPYSTERLLHSTARGWRLRRIRPWNRRLDRLVEDCRWVLCCRGTQCNAATPCRLSRIATPWTMVEARPAVAETTPGAVRHVRVAHRCADGTPTLGREPQLTPRPPGGAGRIANHRGVKRRRAKPPPSGRDRRAADGRRRWRSGEAVPRRPARGSRLRSRLFLMTSREASRGAARRGERQEPGPRWEKLLRGR